MQAQTSETQDPGKTARQQSWFPLLFLAFTALMTLPILLPAYPPLVDYASNLTRADILSRYSQVEHFRNIYAIQHAPLANLAIDLVVPPLARVMGTFAAGKLFLVLELAVYAAGCYLLCGVSQGLPTWIPFLLVCFFYNTAVTTGFMNYIAGMAVYLVTFACWLRWSTRWTTGRATAFAALAVCCYFAHLSSIVMLGISVFAVWCWELRAGRMRATTLLWSATGFVVPGALFLVMMRGPGQIGKLAWNTLEGKLQDLPLVVRTYNLRFDVALLAVALIIGLLWVVAASGVSVHSPTLVAGLTLLLCFLLAPKDLFTSNAVDLRFVWPATVLLTAAFRPRVPARRASACLAALLVLWTVRTAVIGVVWEELGNRVAQMVRVFDRLPRAANVYPVTFADSDFDAAKRDQAVRFAINFAVVTRDAYVAGLAATPSQQPIVQIGGLPYGPWKPGLPEAWRGYDYVWTYKATPELLAELRPEATLVASAVDSALWRLKPAH